MFCTNVFGVSTVIKGIAGHTLVVIACRFRTNKIVLTSSTFIILGFFNHDNEDVCTNVFGVSIEIKGLMDIP